MTLFPGCKPSERFGVVLSDFFQMAKIEPIETKQSMLEDPSRGSNATIYFPLFSVSI